MNAEVWNALRLLDDLNKWIGPSLADIFPSPLMHASNVAGALLDINPDQYNRLKNVHNIVEHVYVATKHDATATSKIFTRPSTSGSDTALEHLKADRYDEAYLAAIRSLKPRRTQGLATGHGRRRALDATNAFLDEE